MANAARPPRLVTLAFSHYNEKARWALDHCRVPYVEHGFMPGFSQLAVLVATRGRGGAKDRVSSRFSTPILKTAAGETICDSTAIAHWAETHSTVDATPLFPHPDVEPLVEELGRELGPRTRLVAYYHVFQSETAMRTLATTNVGRGQALAFAALRPLGSLLIKRGLQVDEARMLRATEKVRDYLTSITARLDRHPYLTGESFTAADLTFAALFAPALLITREEGFGATFPKPAELGQAARDLVAEMRASVAGRFALDVYRRHRAPSARVS